MDRIEHMKGRKDAKYGIWNSKAKEWQFNICEDTPMLAIARLHQIIGDDAKKYRFEAKRLPINN